MKNVRNILLKYLITSGVAAGLTVLTLFTHDFWSTTELIDKYRILADAFTIPGVVLVMLTALIWISTDGFFDGLGYVFSTIGHMFLPFYKNQKGHQTYYDYKMEKSGKRAKGYSFLFFVGIVFVAIGVIFIILHGSLYDPEMYL